MFMKRLSCGPQVENHSLRETVKSHQDIEDVVLKLGPPGFGLYLDGEECKESRGEQVICLSRVH